MCCISSNLRFRQDSQCLCFSSCSSRTTESQRGSCGPWGELDGRLAGTSPATPACPFERTTSVRTSRVWYMELNCCSSSGVDEAMPRVQKHLFSLLQQSGGNYTENVQSCLFRCWSSLVWTKLYWGCWIIAFSTSSTAVVVIVEALPRVFKHGGFCSAIHSCLLYRSHFILDWVLNICSLGYTILGHLCERACVKRGREINFFCPLPPQCKRITVSSSPLSFQTS